jgi:hypothetical protein
MYHDKMHWGCCGKPQLAKFFWLLAFGSLLGAWFSRGGIWWGWDVLTWYWNALVLGVLGIGLKMLKHHGSMRGEAEGGCDKCGMHERRDGHHE